MERKTEEDVVMRTWKMEVGGQRHIGRQKLRWSDLIRIYMKAPGERSKDKRSTKPENVEIENSMSRPQIGKRPKKLMMMTV